MALGVSEDHLELAASVRGWAGRHGAPPGTARTAIRTCCGPPWPGRACSACTCPGRSGGQGFGLSELAVALEELGHALLPGGFLPTVLAGALLAAARPAEGETRKLLAGLADGSRSGAVALARRADRHGESAVTSSWTANQRRSSGPGWPTWSCCRC